MLKQCTMLRAKVDFRMSTGHGKPWTIHAGQFFWVTSSVTNNAEGCKIDRKGKGFAGSGAYLDNQQILELFDVL